MNIDIQIQDERVNIHSYLKQLESFCHSNPSEASKAFDLLYEVWEKVSPDLWNQGYWQDYSKSASVVLSCAKTASKQDIEAQVANELGYFYMERGDYDIAQNYFTISLNIAIAQQDLRRESQSLRYLGTLHVKQEDFEQALVYFKQVQIIIDQLPGSKFADEKWLLYQAELPNLLGEIYLKLEQFPQSLTYLKTSLQYYQELIELHPYYRYFLADPLLNVGRWYFLNSELEEAESYYQDCLQLCQEIKRTDTQASVLIALAQLTQYQNQFEEAVQYAEQATAVAGTEHPTIRDEASQMLIELKGCTLLPSA